MIIEESRVQKYNSMIVVLEENLRNLKPTHREVVLLTVFLLLAVLLGLELAAPPFPTCVVIMQDYLMEWIIGILRLCIRVLVHVAGGTNKNQNPVHW